MKNSLCILTGLLLATSPLAFASDLAASFTWQFPLQGEYAESGLYRVATPGPLFDSSQQFPNDLRIIDNAGNQWPFYLWQPEDTRRFESRTLGILNRAVTEEDSPHLRQDLHIEGARAPHNRIVIESAGQNFVRRVEVMGSEDRTTWGKLADGYLIDHAVPARVRNTEIRYPDSDFPYLQLRIYPNARDAGESVIIDQVQVGRYTGSEAERAQVEVDLTSPDTPSTEPFQTLFLDSGFVGQPIEWLILQVAEAAFSRPLQVFGRNLATESWRPVSNGEIHRLGNTERLRIPVSGTWREWKLQVYHYDDVPLTIESIRAECVPRYLVFEARSTGPAHLYVGSDQVDAPRYDLRQRKGVADAAQASLRPLGPRTANQEFKTDPAQAFLPWITGGAIAGVSLVILWVVAGMLKRSPALNE